MTTRVAFVPAAPVLLPEYAGIEDPVPALRAACVEAVTWLGKDLDDNDMVGVVAPPPTPADRARGVETSVGLRLAAHLADRAAVGPGVQEVDAADPATALLVLGSGSARRDEKAPGHLDERAFPFDEQVLGALASGDPAALAGVDEELGTELLADGLGGLRAVARALTGSDVQASVLYADDPFGVQYWVVTWECRS